MADINIKFNLKQPKADKETPIRLAISWQGERLITNTGESVPPKYWNTSQQVRATKEYPQYSQINKRLTEIMAKVSAIYHRLKTVGEYVPKSELKEELDIYFNRTTIGESVPKDFLKFVDYIVAQKKGTLNPKNGRVYSRMTLSKYSRVKELCKDINANIDFKHFNENFYSQKYQKKMIELNMANNTIGKYTQTLKTILAAANSSKYNNVNRYTHYKEYPVLKEESHNIFLTDLEIMGMYKLDLSHIKRLERVRDMFVIGCNTGFRFSDIYAISKQHIEGDYIRLKTFKTGKKVTVPIFKTTREILEKYDYVLPQKISNQKCNDYIKEVGTLAGLNDKIFKTMVRSTGEDVTIKNKYELISTHTARRSFCTNLYNKGVPPLSICAITGHATESMLLTYLKIDKEDHALRVLQMITDLESTKPMYANG